MDLNLQGHAAIVQGGSKGIGRGIAEALAAEGCDIVLTARNREALEKTAADLAASTGRRVLPYAADTANLVEIPALLDAVRAEFGRLDIIVCNSGGPPPGRMKDLTAEQWSAAAQLLVVSPVSLLRQALPLLEKSPAPRFFVVTSSSSRTPIPGLTLSNVYRPAVVGLVKTLTDEFSGTELCCHSIAPGRFDTDRLGHVIDIQVKETGGTREEVIARMAESIPARRLGEPIEIGHLVAFLSSPLAAYLRGGNWLVDGGLVRAV